GWRRGRRARRRVPARAARVLTSCPGARALGRALALPGRSGTRGCSAIARRSARRAGARRSARRARAAAAGAARARHRAQAGGRNDALSCWPAALSSASPARSEAALPLVRRARARRACAPRRLAPRATPRPLYALLPLRRGSAAGVGAQPGAGAEYRAMTETETATETDEQPTPKGSQRLTSLMRWERFAWAVVSGKTLAEAYREAGYTPASDEAARAAASRLLTHPVVRE